MCIFAPQNWTFEKFEYMKTSALFGTASYDLLVGNSGASAEDIRGEESVEL